jgi:isochorismate synthase EntC
VDVDGNGEFAVGIRCAQIDGNAALAHAGVGIVDGSDPEVEFEETKAKFKTVLRALTESARHG